MDDVFRIVAFLLFVCLSVLVVYIVLRSSSVGRARRRSATFRTAIADIGTRATAAIAPVSAEVDELRRGLRAPASVGPGLTAARSTLEALAAEAAAIPAPDAVPAGGTAVAADLRRAAAALGAIHAGCAAQAGDASRASELDAQSAVKRGYLELQHAREALARDVEDAVRAADDGRGGGAAARS